MASDITLQCADCGADFKWTVGDQRFYQEKGFQQPKRCHGCREKKRNQRGDRHEDRRNDRGRDRY